MVDFGINLDFAFGGYPVRASHQLVQTVRLKMVGFRSIRVVYAATAVRPDVVMRSPKFIRASRADDTMQGLYNIEDVTRGLWNCMYARAQLVGLTFQQVYLNNYATLITLQIPSDANTFPIPCK